MIRLTCANCQAQLEVDDAFAGGVCRCKHCGAIQTVPRRGQSAGKALAGKGVGGDEPKTLYSAKSRAGLASTPSGLEELAEAVHGSGLAGSGLLNRPVPRAPVLPNEVAKKSNTGLIVGIAIGLLVIIGGIVGYMMLRGDSTASNEVANHQGGPVTMADKLPTFAGVPIAGRKVIYVLDRGDATTAFFPALRDLTVKSVRELGPNKLFQVILWDNGSTDAYPALTPGYGSADEADKLARWFDQVPTGRSTDALPALKLAMAGNPDTVVLATGKSLQLDDAFVDSVLKARTGQTPIHAITLGETAPDDPLRKIASQTGGAFKALPGNDLGTISN